MRLVTLRYVSAMKLVTLFYVSEMRLVTFLFAVSILFDYGATLPCLTTGSKKDFANTRNALKSLESYLSKTVSTLQNQITNINGNMKKTVSTLQSQITTINGKVKTLDKDLITIEEDFKGKFSLSNLEIRI
jgi:TolA-binding protein